MQTAGAAAASHTDTHAGLQLRFCAALRQLAWRHRAARRPAPPGAPTEPLLVAALRVATAAAARVGRDGDGDGGDGGDGGGASAAAVEAAAPMLRALVAVATAAGEGEAGGLEAHPLVSHHVGARLLKRLAKTAPGFASLLLQAMRKGGDLAGWARRGAAWVVLALLEAPQSSAEVCDELTPSLEQLAASEADGCRTLSAALRWRHLSSHLGSHLSSHLGSH